MRRPATNILLLVIYGLCCHFQPTVARVKCFGRYAHICSRDEGNRKRSDIDEMPSDLRTGGEWQDIQETREGERRRGGGGGDREINGYRDTREGDVPRSEFNERRRLSEEKQLFDIANPSFAPHSDPPDSELSRPRSLLGTTPPDVDGRDEEEEEQDEEEEEEEKEKEGQRQAGEPPRRSNTDTNRRHLSKDMLRRILDDLERELDPEPVSDSVNKKPGYADDTEDNRYSLKKRTPDQ